ncbi:MAG TPA: DUF2934 domain-containing protein [Terriglobales bacterium]|nr:DUF2934 domain-containing protein [Terriglobales bacterium]
MNKDTGTKRAGAVHGVPAGLPAEIDEAIRRRAYELYEARGWRDGYEVEDWLRAEGEINQQKPRTIVP